MAQFNAENAISASEGTAFLTTNNQNIELFYAKKISATIEKNKKVVKAVGNRMEGSKTLSAKGIGSLTVYEITSFFKKMMHEYVKKGIDRSFALQLTNSDPNTPYGRETKMLYGCNFDKVIIALLDAEDGILEQDLSFTFYDFDLLETFKEGN